MVRLTIQLTDTDHQHLLKVANRSGKSVQELFQEWVSQLPEIGEDHDVTKDPLFQIEGYESEAPADLSIKVDEYLYGDNYPK